jgi:chromosome segregation ATPase
MNFSNWEFKGQQNQQSTPKLLPPSVFEKTLSSTSQSGSDETALNQTATFGTSVTTITQANETSQFKHLISELDRFKYEINKLKSENDVLRNKNRNFVEQAQLYNESSAQFQQQHQHQSHNHCQISISTLEDIIHKQSNEIEQLKADKQDFQVKLNEKQMNINNLISVQDALQAKLNGKTETENQYKNEIASINNQMQQLKTTNERIQADLNTYKSSGDLDYLNTLKKEAYVADTNYKTEMNRNKQLSNEIDLLKIRLKSIEDILTMQEKQLDSPSTKNLSNSQKRSSLLSKWRHKVI